MKTAYRVLEPLRHDGTDYAPGATVDLETTAASSLLSAGVVEGPASAEAPDEEGEPEVPVLGGMTKAQLVDYARSTYSVELDPGDTKAALLQAIHALEAEA